MVENPSFSNIHLGLVHHMDQGVLYHEIQLQTSRHPLSNVPLSVQTRTFIKSDA